MLGRCYVSLPLTAETTLGTNDFTIAGWFKLDRDNVSQCLWSFTYNYSSSRYWQGVQVWYNGKFSFCCDLNTSTKNRKDTSKTITTGVWYHVALVRYNGTATLYVDGENVGTLSANGTIYQDTRNDWKIGASSSTAANPIREPLYGSIDDFMIINGKALWTKNFIPPNRDIGYPQKIRRVEYIESTGTQYIDTGILMDENTTVEVDFAMTQNRSTDNPVFGSFNNPYGLVFGGRSGNIFRFAYGSGWNGNTAPFDMERHIAIGNSENKECLLDGNVLATETNITNGLNSATNIHLFHFYGGSTNYYGYARIFSSKIYKNGKLVQELIPCLDIDGIYCMYDKITKKYFYKSGTGEFKGGGVI